MNRELLLRKVWWESRLPVLLEGFVLVILGGTLLEVVILNQMNLETHYRIGIGITLLGLAWIASTAVHNYKNPAEKQASDKDQQHQPEIKSEIVARLWSPIVKAPSPGHQIDVGFAYQELFYQWVLTLDPEIVIPNASITVAYLALDDAVSILPPDAVIGEPKEGWVLGFEEKTRKPDFYLRVFEFTNISKHRPLKISVRRSITELIQKGFQLAEPNIIRISDMSCPDPTLSAPQYDPTKEAQRLNRQVVALRHLRGSQDANGSPLPFRSDSGILPGPGETQASVELHCQNED